MSGTADAAIVGNADGANTSTIADAAGAAAVAKTCVTALDAKPDADGDYVMFDGANYTVFKLPADVTKLDNVAADAKFFKVLPDETKGGRRKSRKSAKKQRKSAKKQHKSSKKQRKSRGSRRSKK